MEKENTPQDNNTNSQENGSQVSDNADITKGINPLDEAIVDEKYNNIPLQARIRAMRKNADIMFRTLKEWNERIGLVKSGSEPLFSGREILRYTALAITSMESARQFYGKILKEKGAVYPYAKDNSMTTIPDQGEPMNDVPEKIQDACVVFRDKIEEQIVEMVIYVDQVAHLNVLDFISQNTVIQKMMEAKHWLGEIIGVISRANASQATTL